MSQPLDGMRVLDFSRVLAGPFATMQLADLGADVVKVERPDGGDDTRAWGPPHDASGRATYFEAANRNKRSVALDLTDARDLAIARDLALDADVVVENFRPGLMSSFGLDHDDLVDGNPGLVYCSISGFGHGAGRTLPGYDLLIQAMGGLMSLTGARDGEPQKVGVAIVDVLAGLFATSGVLAALRHRDLTGEGQRVDVDLLSSLLAALVNQGSAFTAGGVVPTRLGNQHPSIAPYELFDAADGQVVVAVGNDRQFARLCAILGREDLATDPRFVTNSARVTHRDELRSHLTEAFGTSGADDWIERLIRARVPAGRVNDVAGAFAFAESIGLDPVVRVARSDGSTASLTRSPLRLSRTPVVYRDAPPDLPSRSDAASSDDGPAGRYDSVMWRGPRSTEGGAVR